MFSNEVSVLTKASPLDIWNLWSDVTSWAKWDPDVEHCQLKQGSFQQGAKALLKPRGGPKVNVEITECIPHQKFVSHSLLPLTTLVFHHEITPQPSGETLITHRIEFHGLLAPFFYFVMGRGIVKGLPQALNNLSRLAERKV
jgi:hypothetical protein